MIVAAAFIAGPAALAAPSAGAASAGAASTPGGTLPPAVSAAKAEAQRLLGQASAAYGGIRSFSENFDLAAVATNSSNGASITLAPVHGSLTFRRPNQFAYSATMGNSTNHVACDGTRFSSTITQTPDLWSSAAAPKDLDGVLEQAGHLDRVLFLVAPLMQSTLLQRAAALPDIRVAPPAQVNGVPVDVVVTGGSATDQDREYIAIGQKDHLVRRVTAQVGGMKTTITLSDLKINPSLGRRAFEFTPPADPIEPRAAALLNAAAASYQSLHSFSATADFSATGPEILKARTAFSVQQPNLLSADTHTTSQTIRTVSDGTHLYVLTSSSQAAYQQVAAPPSLDLVAASLVRSDPYLGFPLTVFLKNDVFNLVQNRKELASLSVGGTTRVDGVPVDILVGQFKMEPTGAGQTISVFIGRSDHLVRSVALSGGFPARTTTVQFSDLKINPSLPASTFHFVPPPGSKPMAQPGAQGQ